MATTSSGDFYLAKELIFEILSWMPVTSLLRFKSVCMSWFSIISSPAFIENHLKNSKKKQPSSLVYFPSRTKYPFNLHDVVCIHSITDERVRINIPRNLIGINQFFCSCNGLLFHLNKIRFLGREVLFIWNPVTKWLKELPVPEKTSILLHSVNVGFGFDFISNDYKILRIVYHSLSCVVIEAEMYSVNSDSWREIQVPNALRSSLAHSDSRFVHVNGVLYSIANDKLLAFDLHNEVFGVFPLLNPQHYTRRSVVLDYEGSVAMIFKKDGCRSVLSLWTLDDVSWTKKFNFEVDHSKVSWIHLYLGVGQFFARDSNFEYIIYDHKKKQTKKFHLPLVANDVSLAMYTESLVSVEGFEHEE